MGQYFKLHILKAYKTDKKYAQLACLTCTVTSQNLAYWRVTQRTNRCRDNMLHYREDNDESKLHFQLKLDHILQRKKCCLDNDWFSSAAGFSYVKGKFSQT